VNGIHDLGGMHGFGPIETEPNEPVFHHDWEARVFAMNLAMGFWRKWNIDMGRFTREQMAAAEYLSTTYYDHWLFGLERLLSEKGFLRRDEIDARERQTADVPPDATVKDGALRPADVTPFVSGRKGARMPDDVPPKFKAGDHVVARNMNPVGHTRLPRYVRGHRGVVDRDHGVFVFPDTNAAGAGRKPQHVYAVRFTARELWGADASARDYVYVDLWDDYLDTAAVTTK